MVKIYDCLYAKKRGSILNLILDIALIAVVAVMIAEVLFGVFYRCIYVVHSSMYPTLNGAEGKDVAGGDYIYINVYSRPDYGDIVVLYNGEQNIIKRAIAFGGDTVMIEEGRLYIMYSGGDGYTLIDEPYVAAENNDYYNYGPYTVEDNCVFLMGDNRNVSDDSRNHGAYPVKNILGVMPRWSMKLKSAITAIHTFFNFTLPRAFGIKR